MRVKDTDGAAEQTLLVLLQLVDRTARRKIVEKWVAEDQEVVVLRWWLTELAGSEDENAAAQKSWLYQTMRKHNAAEDWDNAKKAPKIRWEIRYPRHHRGYVNDKLRFVIEPHHLYISSVLVLLDGGEFVCEVGDTQEGKYEAARILREEMKQEEK